MGSLCSSNGNNGDAVATRSSNNSDAPKPKDNATESKSDNNSNNVNGTLGGVGASGKDVGINNKIRLIDLSKEYDEDTKGAAGIIGSLFGPRQSDWIDNNGNKLTQDDFDNVVLNNEDVKKAIEKYSKLDPHDRFNILFQYFNYRLHGDSNKSLQSFMEINEETKTPELQPFFIQDSDIDKITHEKDVAIINQLEQDIKDQDISDFVETQLKEAITNSVTAKASGADRAFTSIVDPATNGIKVKLAQFGNVDVEIDESVLTQDATQRVQDRYLVCIESGALVGNIEDHYWPNNSTDECELKDENGNYYKCLPMRGGFRNLSIIGLSSVGAMGYASPNTNLSPDTNQIAIQECLASLRVMTVEKNNETGELQVKKYQIESDKEPIHDPTKWSEKYPDITLIQKDETFQNWVTSFGTYGVITHAIIKLTDAHYLAETREIIDIKDWEAKYNELASDDSVLRMELWFSPYNYSISGDKKYNGIANYSAWRRVGPEVTKPDKQEYIKKNGGSTRNQSLSTIKFAAGVMITLANLNDKLAQAVAMKCTLETTIDSKKGIIMSCVQALDFGNSNYVSTASSGNGFLNTNTVDIVNNYNEFLRKLRDQHKCYITSPYGLRFSQKSNGSMSIAGSYNATWFETIILSGTHRATELLSRAFYEYFMNPDTNANAKVHWGLYFPMEDNLKDYAWKNIDQDKVKLFFDQYKQFNSGKVFSNTFTKLSGMDD